MAETLHFEASDGVELIGDFARPSADVAGDPVGAAIICHPHPQYGGNRFNDVVGALFTALPAIGIAVLRFDFRQVFDDGRGELLDADAALATVGEAVPDVPLFAIGYSFGAAIVLGLDNVGIAAKVLVAPPLAAMDAKRGMDVQTLVLTPEHDQFSPPGATEPIIASWPTTTHITIEAADHFLTGHTARVAEHTVATLTPHLNCAAATDTSVPPAIPPEI